MRKTQLGLPLEYSQLSQYFDALSQGDEHLKNSTIEKILKKHKVKTVLDLTCGTGSQVFWLAKRGYKVIGADLSPALLEIAKERAQKESLDVEFIEGDMRTPSLFIFSSIKLGVLRNPLSLDSEIHRKTNTHLLIFVFHA
jgi:cyclopropane fatty-acyl-phospholipid synthase-like methyltransferase